MAVHTQLSPEQAADRLAIRELFDDLNQYDVTTHFNGQSTIAHQLNARRRFGFGTATAELMAAAVRGPNREGR